MRGRGSFGGDTALSEDVAVGVAVGFGQPELDSYDLADAEIDGDGWFVSGYGTVTRDRWEFAGLLGYAWGSDDSTRRIRFGSIDRTAQGDFDGDRFIASARAAYFYQVDGIDVVPEFGLTHSKIWQDGFTETGADILNLKVEDADAHSLVTSLGVRVGTEVQNGPTRIWPQEQDRATRGRDGVPAGAGSATPAGTRPTALADRSGCALHGHERLIRRLTTVEAGMTLQVYRASTCPSCAIRAQCTTSKQPRPIRRWEHEAVIDALQPRLDREPEKMRVRRQTGEHPFGTLTVRAPRTG